MIIEENILKHFRCNVDIKYWEWGGPGFVCFRDSSRDAICFTNGRDYDLIKEIDLAEDTECLTSESHYIRECKKWLIKTNSEWLKPFEEK